MESNIEIAKTILSQLGGNRFVAMTGSKNFVYDHNSLSMRLTSNKVSDTFLNIKLTVMDLYDMKFMKLRGTELITVSEHNGIYCDQLQEIFTSVTGLYTHL